MGPLKIFFDAKRQVYFYATGGTFPLCSVCEDEIKANLVYHTVWRRTGDRVRLYHMRCLGKVQHRGEMDEFKTCVVTEKPPEGALPIFERSPALSNTKGYSTFQVHKITAGEGEVRDYTKISRDPNQSKMLDYDKNARLLEKKDEDLGQSAFLLNDMRRDKEKQKDAALQKIVKKALKEDDDKNGFVYEKAVVNEVNLDQFFSAVKGSTLLLPGDRKLLK